MLMFMPTSLISSSGEGAQLIPIQITQIEMKPKYGSFNKHAKYDVIYIDPSDSMFLIRDDDGDPVWVDFDKCKLVKQVY
jgi:hypothetical protein